MPERSSSERLEEYVAVLRGIGLTESAVVNAHGDREQPDGDVTSYLADVVPGTEETQLHDALGDAIATSARGIDAPAEYWNHAPEVHLDELLAPYGCSIAIQPSKWADTLAEGELVVRLTDANGTEFWTRFDYPESELGTDNYPALLHHVEEQLLAPAGLRIVRLVGPRGRWRFAMMSVEQLDALQSRYGERLRIFGAPLLAADQPAAFANEHPPVPPWYDATEGTEDGAAGEEDVSLVIPEAESLDDLEPTDADLGFDVEDSPETIVESVEDDSAGSGTTAAVSGGDEVEASDDQVQSVFGDLSDVTLEPEDPDPEPAGSSSSGGTLAIDGGATAATDADDPIDDLFDEMKRDIADSEVETGENADAGRDANIADLVGGVDEGSPASDDRDDVPQDAADLTASELFSSLNEE